MSSLTNALAARAPALGLPARADARRPAPTRAAVPASAIAAAASRAARLTRYNNAAALSRSAAVPRRVAAIATSAAPTLARTAEATDISVVDGIEVISCATGEAAKMGDLVNAKGRVLLPFLTMFGDFDSWELAQRLVDEIPRLEAGGVQLLCVGIGNLEAGKAFCEKTGFPPEMLYADPTGACCAAMGFEPGFGRLGGASTPDWLAKLPIHPYIKLTIMCAGIGSPGTLPEVFRGYLGDRDREPVFQEGTNVDVAWRQLYDLEGKGFQRPMELATLRLFNMGNILGNWDLLTPPNKDLILQRGGAVILEDRKAVFRHDDPGILGYIRCDRLCDLALRADPAAAPDAVETLHACAERKAYVEDAFEAIRYFEKKKDKPSSLEKLNGQWRLQYTTGTKEVAANINRTGGGAYFPIKAIQSFNAETGHIRNGVYLGPACLFFDGKFLWRDKIRMLEFQFDKISFQCGPLGPWSRDLGESAWSKLKVVEQDASSGQGAVERATEGKPGSQPFFKFVFADDKCCAARGRGGGLALWARESMEPAVIDE